jgi:hypothetical protein
MPSVWDGPCTKQVLSKNKAAAWVLQSLLVSAALCAQAPLLPPPHLLLDREDMES